MDYLDHIKNPHHHSYLIFSDSFEIPNIEGVRVISFDKPLGVEEARDLHEYAYGTSGNVTNKIILKTKGVTDAAQNALLKIFEDIPSNAVFYLFVPQRARILKTLQSRCFVIHDSNNEIDIAEVKSFFEMSPKNRFDYLNTLLEKDDASRHMELQRFLNASEKFAHELFKDGENTEKLQRLLTAIKHIKGALHVGGVTKSTVRLLAFV